MTDQEQRVAAALKARAIELKDEHGTDPLVVNTVIIWSELAKAAIAAMDN